MLIFRLYVAASMISVAFIIVTIIVFIFSSDRNNGKVSRPPHYRFIIYLVINLVRPPETTPLLQRGLGLSGPSP